MKTKATKFGPAVSESNQQYHRRKLRSECSFRIKRIRMLLSAIEKDSPSDIDAIVSKVEEVATHSNAWQKFSQAIQRLTAPVQRSPSDDPNENP